MNLEDKRFLQKDQIALKAQEKLKLISMSEISWWIRWLILLLIGLFFLHFGIHLLIVAYKLNDPALFIMTFFASNLIILISATLVIGFVCQMWRLYKKSSADTD